MDLYTTRYLEKFLWLTLGLGMGIASSSADAVLWSGNLTVTSDYVSKRGISLTDGSLAIQPQIRADFSNGAYLGIWGSNVDFDPVWGEIDLFAGITGPVTSRFNAGIGIIHYESLGDSSQNFQEYFVNSAINNNIKLMYSYSPDFSGVGQRSGLAEASGFLPLYKSISLHLHGGRQNFWGNKDILENFYFWQVALRHTVGQLSISLKYSDTTSDQFLGRADARTYLAAEYGW